MSNKVGKTIKLKGYKSSHLVGVIATLDASTRTGIFVGYLNTGNVGVRDIKEFRLNFDGQEYTTEQQYVRDLQEGIIQVNDQEIKGSRMPKELGDVVRGRVKNIQRWASKKEDDIVVNLSNQREYKQIILKRFERALAGDPDLDDDAYFAGIDFISNKGFYLIEKSEVSGIKKEELQKLSDKAIEYIALFSQDMLGGSHADYYVYALKKAYRDHYLYLGVKEIKPVLDKVRDNLRDHAINPEKTGEELMIVIAGYQRLPVRN